MAQLLHPSPQPQHHLGSQHCPAEQVSEIVCPPGVSRQDWSVFLKSGSKVVLHLPSINATADCSWPSLPQHMCQAKLNADAADMQMQPSPPILLNSSSRQLSLYVLQSVGDRRGCMPALSPTSICRQLLCSLCMGWAVGVCSRAQRMESAPVAR